MNLKSLDVAAGFLDCSVDHLRKLIRTNNDFPAYQPSWEIKVDMDELPSWVRQHPVKHRAKSCSR